jgi:hypothetical protein
MGDLALGAVATNSPEDLIESDGVRVWRTFTCSPPELPYDLRGVLAFDQGRLVLQELTAIQRPGGPPVRTEGLMRLQVGRLIRALGPEIIVHGGATPALQPSVAKEGPTDDAIRATAVIWRTAYALGDSTTVAVMDRLELSRATAERWIARARSAGYLPPTPRPASAAETWDYIAGDSLASEGS